MEHYVEGGPVAPGWPAAVNAADDGAQVVVLEAELRPGETLRMTKFVAYHWAEQAPAGDPPGRGSYRTLDRADRAWL